MLRRSVVLVLEVALLPLLLLPLDDGTLQRQPMKIVVKLAQGAVVPKYCH
jgi:hypothetical protein